MRIRIRVRPRIGEGIVFDGTNIEEICTEFNLLCTKMRSKSTYKDGYFNDYRIISEEYGTEEDVLAGDVVFEDSITGEISVIPYMDFVDEWEIIN